MYIIVFIKTYQCMLKTLSVATYHSSTAVLSPTYLQATPLPLYCGTSLSNGHPTTPLCAATSAAHRYCIKITISNQSENHSNQYAAFNHKNTVRISGLGFSDKKITGIPGVSQGATEKVLNRVRYNKSYPGTFGASIDVGQVFTKMLIGQNFRQHI